MKTTTINIINKKNNIMFFKDVKVGMKVLNKLEKTIHTVTDKGNDWLSSCDFITITIDNCSNYKFKKIIYFDKYEIIS